MAFETTIATSALPQTQSNRVGSGVSRADSRNARANSSAEDTNSVGFMERTARAAGQAVYFSPRIKFDQEAQALIIQYRNENTGETTRQYPSPEAVKAYVQTAEQNQDVLGPLPDAQTGSGGAQSGEPNDGSNVVAFSTPAATEQAPSAPPREVQVSTFGAPRGGQSETAYAFGSYAQIASFRSPFGSPIHERAVA